jgi:hypothetical protein
MRLLDVRLACSSVLQDTAVLPCTRVNYPPDPTFRSQITYDAVESKKKMRRWGKCMHRGILELAVAFQYCSSWQVVYISVILLQDLGTIKLKLICLHIYSSHPNRTMVHGSECLKPATLKRLGSYLRTAIFTIVRPTYLTCHDSRQRRTAAWTVDAVFSFSLITWDSSSSVF